MKKLFLVFTLAAAVATSFVSCNKTTNDSDTHTQKFTLGAESFDIKNAITIENAKDSIGQIYNVLVLSQSEQLGTYGSKSKGAVIVFKGNFTPGTHNLVLDPQQPLAHFPMYLIADLQVDDIMNFSIDSLLNQADVYVANSGSFTLAMNQNQFTVTTNNVQVLNVNETTQVKTSSIDFEGDALRYALSTVVEGNLNGNNILTAGRTVINLFNFPTNIIAFVAENGDVIGFITSTSFDEGIPAGTYSNSGNLIIYIQALKLSTLKFASGGEMTVAKNGDNYTIDMTGLVISGIDSPTLHYVGTMPSFDFPFLN